VGINVWAPVTAAQYFALRTELNAIFVQAIVVGIDINRDTKRRIAETGSVSLRIQIATCPSNTIVDYLINFLVLLNQFIKMS